MKITHTQIENIVKKWIEQAKDDISSLDDQTDVAEMIRIFEIDLIKGVSEELYDYLTNKN